MAGTFKVGGGIDPMHLTNTKHPFGSARGMKTVAKFAHTTGVIDGPAGEGNMVSANSARGKVKGSINGPGVAK
jgi:hypothetical protein